MIAKVFNFILGYDLKIETSVILSTDQEKIVLPTFTVDKPKLILDEIRYNTKNLFNDQGLKYIELISLSFLEMQNQYLLNYLNDHKEQYSYNEDEDLCVMAGFVMAEKYMTKLHWLPIPKEIEYKKQDEKSSFDTLSLLVDHVIKNMVL